MSSTAGRMLAFGLLMGSLLMGCSGRMPRIVILDDPLSAEEHLNLGASYEARGEFDAALEEYRSASKGGLKARAELYTGNVKYRMRDLEAAQGHYRRAIEEDPGLADAYNNLAWLLLEEGKNLGEAERLAAEAVRLSSEREGRPNPNFVDTLERVRTARRPWEDRVPPPENKSR